MISNLARFGSLHIFQERLDGWPSMVAELNDATRFDPCIAGTSEIGLDTFCYQGTPAARLPKIETLSGNLANPPAPEKLIEDVSSIISTIEPTTDLDPAALAAQAALADAKDEEEAARILADFEELRQPDFWDFALAQIAYLIQEGALVIQPKCPERPYNAVRFVRTIL